MSAMGGIVPMRSHGELVSDGSGTSDGLGVVVPLRSEPPPVPVSQPGSPVSELGPISPELALVDPELARAARELMPDLPRAAPFASQATAAVAEQAAFVERLRSGLEPMPDLDRPRRRRRFGLLASATGLIAVGVLLTLLLGREGGPVQGPQQTRSVAAAVSPPDLPRPQAARSPTRQVTPARTATTPGTSPVHAPPTPGQTFVWATEPGAAAYEFELFQRGERIFRARVDQPRLELPGRWRENGRPHALLPGSYRWYVWPVSGRTNRQSTAAIVQARLVIEGEPR